MISDQLKISDFYDLEVWKQAHQVVISIYTITKTFPIDERYGIVDQLRRASSSITANIAEGFGRYHYTDRIHFYIQARGSLKEVQNFILLSKDIKYINETFYETIWGNIKNVEKLLNGLIRSCEKLKKNY